MMVGVRSLRSFLRPDEEGFHLLRRERRLTVHLVGRRRLAALQSRRTVHVVSLARAGGAGTGVAQEFRAALAGARAMTGAAVSSGLWLAQRPATPCDCWDAVGSGLGPCLPEALEATQDEMAGITPGGLVSTWATAAEIEVGYANSAGVDQDYRKTLFALEVSLLAPDWGLPPLRIEDGAWNRMIDRVRTDWRRWNDWRRGGAALGGYEPARKSPSVPPPRAVVFLGQAARLLLSLVAAAGAGLNGPPIQTFAVEGLVESGRFPFAPSARPFDDEGAETVSGDPSRPTERGRATFRDGVLRPSVATLVVPAGASRWSDVLGAGPGLVVETATALNDAGGDGSVHLRVDLGWAYRDGAVQGLGQPVVLSGNLGRLEVSALGDEVWAQNDLWAPPLLIGGFVSPTGGA